MKRLRRRALLPYDALPARSSTRLATGGSSKSPGKEEGRPLRLRYICGILCHLTRRDGGEHSSALELPTLSRWGWVGCIELQGEPLTGSTRPSEKKQRQLLPSTEFPDPSSHSSPPRTLPCSAGTPWRGGRNQHYYATTTATEPQMWARRVNLKLKSMSRDGRFQQVTMAPRL